MKRLASLFLVLLPTLSIGAQTKASYTERLDSIVMYDHRYKRKIEFAYNGKGQTAQILYYRENEDGWSLTNKREYFYDEQGRDTLRVVFDRKDGEWEVLQQRYNTYGRLGEKLQERTVSYAKGEMLTESKWDYVYNEEGKQVSASKYWRRIRTTPEEWKKERTVEEEYDAKGNHVKEMYEYLNMQSNEKGTTIMCYDEEGRLTEKVDSSYNVLLGGREWRRQDFSYAGQQLSVMKDMITTIDHDMVWHSLDEYLFDPQGNLLQKRRYRQRSRVLKHVGSESYFYDLNRESSSIMGYDLLPEILELEEAGQFHHKLIMLSDIWYMDEDDEDDAGKDETRLYYSPI